MSAEDLRAYFIEHHDFLIAIADARLALQRYRMRVQQYSHQFGLTLLQYTVLVVLSARAEDDLPTVGDLAQTLSLTHPACVQLLNRMEEKGLITRVESGQRAYIRMTEHGMRTMYALWTDPIPQGEQAMQRDVRRVLIDALQRVLLFEAAAFAEESPEDLPREPPTTVQ